MKTSDLVIWLCETYEAKHTVGHRIAAKEWRNAAFAMLVQVVMQENEIDKEAAEALLVEEVNEFYRPEN